MRSSPSANRSIFSLGTPEERMMEERSISSTPSRSRSPLTLSVDEEYGRAFKSKSFLELWSNAQHNLMRNTNSTFFKRSSSSNKSNSTSSCGSSSLDDDQEEHDEEQSCSSYTVLDDLVLEPRPEVLRRRRRRHVDSLLIDYFDMTQEACEACSDLLAAITAARRHHLTLRRLLCRMINGGASARDALADHVRLDNPLSLSPSFHDVHGRWGPFATRLASAQRRLRRRARVVRVAASAAAIVAAAVFAAHAVVGPAVRWANKEKASGGGKRRRAVDAAARGAYIVGRDMDTLSRMVRRTHDELEHGRHVARIAVVNDVELLLLLQEVSREEADCEAELREQLHELEEHVCLCLITINRTRRMVAHHLMAPSPSSSSPSLNNKTPS